MKHVINPRILRRLHLNAGTRRAQEIHPPDHVSNVSSALILIPIRLHKAGTFMKRIDRTEKNIITKKRSLRHRLHLFVPAPHKTVRNAALRANAE